MENDRLFIIIIFRYMISVVCDVMAVKLRYDPYAFKKQVAWWFLLPSKKITFSVGGGEEIKKGSHAP